MVPYVVATFQIVKRTLAQTRKLEIPHFVSNCDPLCYLPNLCMQVPLFTLPCQDFRIGPKVRVNLNYWDGPHLV